MDKKTVIIREFPVDLHRELKVRAAREGKPLYQLIIEILQEAAKKGEK